MSRICVGIGSDDLTMQDCKCLSIEQYQSHGRAGYQRLFRPDMWTVGRNKQAPPIQGRLFLNASRLWAAGLGDVPGLLNGGCVEGITTHRALLPLQRW
jgi:hypothetical protein